WPAASPETSSRASIPGPSKRSVTASAETPARTNFPDASVVVERPDPTTVTLIVPLALMAPTAAPDAALPGLTVPWIVAPGESGGLVGESSDEPQPAAQRPDAIPRMSSDARDVIF